MNLERCGLKLKVLQQNSTMVEDAEREQSTSKYSSFNMAYKHSSSCIRYI